MMLKESGMLRWMPRMLALRAVQRHRAASRSTRPAIRLQHGCCGGDPAPMINTWAHTANFRLT
ncbi:hypothetical protein Ahy_A01g000667 [Arachis hypogaea]|uniref:Uncharacterized protein n=1 Tax=Arachis hypogaea TaxID=3818 RepID=A0A445EKV2_ARAHY|nr:hypothetical protein Ahy_A01g000667 [Arachis hypogaea]